MDRRHVHALASIRDETVRGEVAAALASTDHIRRHLPVHELPDVVAALWLVFIATDAQDVERWSPAAHRVLVSLAAETLHDVGARLDMYSLLGHADSDAGGGA